MRAEIDTARLILRRFTLYDCEAFFRLGSDPEIIRYAQSTRFESLAAAREAMRRWPLHDYATWGYGRLACVWKATGAVVGFSGVKFVPEIDDNELGYRFLPEYWGMGLATEAGGASIAFARDVIGLKRLVGLVHPDNIASARVLRKLGFAVERQIAWSGLPEIEVDLYSKSLPEGGP